MNRYEFRYILTTAILLAAWIAGVDAMAQGVRVRGNVFGGGNQADVKVNSTVNMNTGQVDGNVYGGGNLGDVGTIDKTDQMNYNYTWTGNSGNTTIVSGLCTVTITDGTVGRTGENATQDEDHGNVFGAGKGEETPTFWCEKGMVYKAIVNIDAGTVKRNVYGGGEVGRVENDTQVTLGTESDGPTIGGSVFGAGAGILTHGYSALVRGNATVTVQGNTEVKGSVYGGGEMATVGKYNIAKTSQEATDHHVKIGMPYETVSGGICTVEVKGSAQIGPDASGHVFGGGKGKDPTNDTYTYSGTTDEEKRSTRPKRMTLKPSTLPNIYDTTNNDRVIWEYFDDKDDYYDFLQTLALAHDTHVTIKGSAKVNGSVYGGSESGFVQNDTDVKIQGLSEILTTGTDSNGKDINGNVFGGGKGVAVFSEAGRVRGNTTVAISGGTTYGNVYGGGELGDVGRINKEDPKKNYKWANERGVLGDDYTYNNTGVCNVSVTDASATIKGHVFGAGKGKDDTFWCEKAIVYKTFVTISAGKVEKDVYGGGEIGRVETDTKVEIGDEGGSNTPEIGGSVFGAGAGVLTHGYSALVRGNTTVTIQAKSEIGKSVYGGGEIASVGKYGLDAKEMPSILKGGGICTVTVKDEAEVGVDGGGNVFGGGQGVSFASVTGDHKRMTLIGGVSDWETFTDNDAYKTFLQTLGLATAPTVTIEGTASVNGSVYGGGEVGITKGAVVVNINGGTIEKDVYGGGALADTNTGNWSPNKNFVVADVQTGAPVTGYFTKGDAYTEITDEDAVAEEGVTYYTKSGETYTEATGLTVGTSSVTGYYTKSDVYTQITDDDAEAESGTDYYETQGGWTDATGTAWKTTTVNLLGGHIKGDAYGGGLGQKDGFNNASGDIEAVVWGDIVVTLNGTKFDITNYGGDHSGVIKSGRVFGCNNLNGSPQGNVTVDVFKTVKGNSERTDEDAYKKKEGQSGYVAPTYEVAAVYGGGNLADFTTTGKKANVIIETCDVSVQSVYGGGNAAAVPETDVLVKGAYEIGEVFGGGNGKDSYTTDGGASVTGWTPNPGADVNGPATTLLKGGYIHEAYGGSNSKGTISGRVTINKASGGVAGCPLDVVELYGAGKDADIEGDLIVILGCSETRTEAVYGCSMNANVKGNVELTITSGEYGKVFGGNNLSGSIFGHIIVNIEEIGCYPIVIDELYLGGNDAAYSVYGYYHAKKNVKEVSGEEDQLYLDAEMTIPLYKDDSGNLYRDAGKTKRLYEDATTHLLYVNEEKTKPLYMPRTSADDQNDVVVFNDHPHTVLDEDKTHYDDPELNIISCTSIGQVFGGGLGTGATLYGNPKVNINMMAGEFAEDGNKGVAKYMSDLHLPSADNPDKLGIIGNVYGGGNAADVVGNPIVNIGTLSSVNKIVWDSTNDKPVYGSDGITPSTTPESVLGAYINGNVFGGGMGEAKMVKGTAGEAFLCAKAMVSGDIGTHVNIGNGMVTGNVYGGGEVGRVEHNTAVKIGLDATDIDQGETSAPIIKGNVFGAGAGVNTHGYSALVRGNSTVTVQADSKVRGCVYGGGEKASVGKYSVVNGLPVALAPDNEHPNSGYCYVYILGNAEIGPDDMEMTKADGPSDAGHVFGAGKGVLPYEGYDAANAQPFHMNGKKVGDGWDDDPTNYPAYNPAAELNANYVKFIKSLALVTQTVVNISGNPFIKGSVYGGSENGFVQQNTHVTISGGQIGNGYVQMDDDGTYLATKRGVNRRYTAAEWAAGHLFVAGDPEIAMTTPTDPDETPAIADATETALRTAVGGNYTSSLPECASWPYGEVIGSGENAKTVYAPYDRFASTESGKEEKYDQDTGRTTGRSTEGGRRMGSDGHTFYGNVFGGGSGYYPYKPGKWFEDAGAVYGDTYVTIKGGHILTSVYGGNEMTDVGKYADNDQLSLTSGGTCYVTMIGGTIGVPRTLKQIDAHPVTCYLFGAGKGDQRVFFNKSTNVGNVVIHISDDARIYGSVLGGGEDGHVMQNVTMNIGGSTLPSAVLNNSVITSVFTGVNLSGSKTVSGVGYPYIGNWGTSYVDGNVFGGGRGFAGDAYTAGNVAGTVTMNLYGGTMLGSVYGGGRLGSVGYGLFNEGVTGYGVMQDDNKMERYDGTINSTSEDFPRGYVYMTIGKDDGTGPTIGNTWEYRVPSASNGPMSSGSTPEPTLPADIKNWTAANWTTWKEHNHVPKTEYDTTTGQLTHTKGGNVFAGGMGRLYQLDGTSYITAVNWWKLGCVKSTTLTIKGGTIKSNVYGGGELGQVVGHHDIKDSEGHTVYTDEEQTTAKVTSTEITIQGSSTTIGTEVKDDSNNTQYTFGSVFGGGYGSLLEVIPGKNQGDEPSYPKFIAGLVKEDTKIDMQNGAVKASIYGGGEMASVGESTTSGQTTTVTGSTYVAVSGGTVGIAPTGSGNNIRYFGGAKMGNVYGGGSGHNNTVRSGRILKNTNVTISNGTIYHNVYGGGAYGTVGDFSYTTGNDGKVNGVNGLTTTGTGTGVATVTITGGTIGYDGKENGMVFGSSRGDINAPGQRDDHTAWVYDTQVSIGTAATPATGTEGEEGYVAATSESGPEIKGTVYGSGENGHVFNDAVVTINGGTIGIAEGSPITTDDNGTPNDISDDTILSGAAYPYRGNVYGGGCGTDKYYSGTVPAGHTANDGEGNSFNPLAGIVYGTTTVNINGGTVVRNVYGAGAMGSVGRTVITTNTDNTTTTTYSGGSTTINVSGGTIGVSGTVGDGNVFGAARGDLSATGDYISQVRQTSVTVSGGTVKGNVYGGGELGDVGTIDKSDQTNYNYNWKDKNGNANNHGNNTILGTNNNTGICTVTVSGGTIGTDATAMNADGTFDNGNVFGGGKGSSTTWWCEKAIAYATNVTITAGTVRGSVYGGGEVGRVEDDAKVTIGLAENDAPTINGSVFGAGKGLMTHGYSALVRGNATVTVQGKSEVVGCVYGGGEIASVGKFHVDNGLPVKPMNGGTCTVIIQDEAKIGSNGTGHNVFGACKGVKSAYNLTNYKNFKSMQLFANRGTGAEKDTWDYYETYPDGYTGHIFVWKYYKTEEDYLAFLKTLALTSNTHVTIDENATIYGSVFGGGERGVTLGGVDVNITGGTVNQDVYGGGSLADTNTAMWDADNNQRMTYVELPELIAGTSATGYYTSKSADALITDANATVQADKTYYAIYKTNVNLKGGTVKGSAYGGGLGQLAKAAVAEQAAVLYADVNEYNTAKGTELSAAAFAALTEAEKTKTPAIEAQDAMSAVEAKVYGDVLVTLNGIKSTETTGTGESATTTNTYYDCEVQDKIFGCNNLNGSPQSAVTVHVYNTVKKNDSGTVTAKPAKESGTYELEAVYGGGNLAAYKPDFEAVADTAKAYVIIDGCDLTSIKQVYGGGNAASSPATNVTVNGTYEIREVFGGGNGADAYQIDGKTYENPGANVGYDSYAYHTWNASQNKYLVSEYGPGDGDDKDASTKEKRLANYQYGSGETHVSIYGGTVHAVYGGSNSKGNVRVASVALLDDEMLQTCEFDVDEAYGGGKNADMDGTATLIMSCIQGMKEVYGGAENADVLNNVTLNITNGTFDQVFGGNNVGGRITGSITVNIEETGCKPVIIGELYGGGNMAGYSIYGYKEVNGKWVPRTSNTDEGTGPASPYSDPQINVKSFTGIGNIFGGGFGETAVMVASPTVNIDVVKGRFSNQTSHERFTNKQWTLDSANKRYSKTIGGATVYVPAHEVNTIGGIYNVFGGGNAAKVIGTPHVKVGTQDYVEITTNLSDVRGYCTRTGGAGTQANPYTYSEPITGENAVTPTANTSYYKKVEGVDIRGNIYGGGNNAEVQGDTDVVIGKAAPTTP